MGRVEATSLAYKRSVLAANPAAASLFTAIVFGILTPLIALLQWNGVLSVGWKLSLAGYFVLAAI
jgi:hypothetical protein